MVSGSYFLPYKRISEYKTLPGVRSTYEVVYHTHQCKIVSQMYVLVSHMHHYEIVAQMYMLVSHTHHYDIVAHMYVLVSHTHGRESRTHEFLYLADWEKVREPCLSQCLSVRPPALS